MISFAKIDQENNGNYLKMLSATAKLSRLFSESNIPYLNYRTTENIFCKSFDAENLSRKDSAFDANYKSIGIGLKTFVCEKQNSFEKIAEFNKLSNQLKSLKGKKLALKLAEFRNDRIELANRTYNIIDSLYHIVARKTNELILFETDYSVIDVKKIHIIKQTVAGIQFNDGNNFYLYNYSKSTLFRKFEIPKKNIFTIPIEIVDDPYSILLELFEQVKINAHDLLIKGENYIILPLYGWNKGQKFLFEKSGLNQWNASGRKRNLGEVYIPIPADIHTLYPDFFPKKNNQFKLKVPTGEIFTAKVCQDNSKALMTNPNKALSNWLLRKVLNIKEGELATIELLDKLGFDSVIILKENNMFNIDIASSDSFENFLNIK